MYCIWKETHTPLSNVNCENNVTWHHITYVHYINKHMKRDPHTLIKCELWNRILLDITLYMYITHTYQKRPTHIKRDPHTLLKYVLTMKRDPHTLLKYVLTMKRDPHISKETHTYQKRPTHPFEICTDYEKRPTHIKRDPHISKETHTPFWNMYWLWKETYTPLSNVCCEKQCYLISHYICTLH